jgi:hypothetical protein
MGMQANCCVHLTAVGGPERPGGRFFKGANELGYAVLSSGLVVRDDPADWKEKPGVWFCTKVDTMDVSQLKSKV